jgi:predicted phosphate transport protein (TIGR00153 family)
MAFHVFLINLPQFCHLTRIKRYNCTQLYTKCFIAKICLKLRQTSLAVLSDKVYGINKSNENNWESTMAGAFTKLMAAITPRSDNYFVLFNKLADCAVRGSKVLAMMTALRGDADKFEEHFAKIREIESEADTYTKEILLSLHKTFITPFDRREIRELAMALDDIIDFMEDIPQSAKIYGHSSFTPEMVALAQILLRASEKVQVAVNMLSDMKNAEQIMRTCEEINRIEGEGDHVMRAGMQRLFSEESDARTIIRSKELYDLFEESIDSCQDVSDVIHGVVLERI